MLGTAVATCAALVAAVWKSSSLKADTHEKWHERVSITEAGLDELASQQLVDLREQIDELFDSGGNFDPRKVVANPATMRGSVRAFLKFLRMRNRLRVYFAIMTHLGPILMIACGALLACAAVVFSDMASDVLRDWIVDLALWFGGISSFVALAGFVLFVVAQHLLGNAEVMVRQRLSE